MLYGGQVQARSNISLLRHFGVHGLGSEQKIVTHVKISIQVCFLYKDLKNTEQVYIGQDNKHTVSRLLTLQYTNFQECGMVVLLDFSVFQA